MVLFGLFGGAAKASNEDQFWTKRWASTRSKRRLASWNFNRRIPSTSRNPQRWLSYLNTSMSTSAAELTKTHLGIHCDRDKGPSHDRLRFLPAYSNRLAAMGAY